jgi:hypothetical protein
MLGAELKLDMARAGKPNLGAIDRTLVRQVMSKAVSQP